MRISAINSYYKYNLILFPCQWVIAVLGWENMIKGKLIYHFRLFFGIFMAAALLISCDSFRKNRPEQTETPFSGQWDIRNPYYITGTREEKEILKKYFAMLGHEAENSQEQFAVIREIANNYIQQKNYGRLINFLSSRIHHSPSDPNNAYYLFMIAYGYQQMDAHPAAAIYFDIIVKNYADLSISGKSIHLACLKQLITLEKDPQQRVWYYEELISRFHDQIDIGPSYFMLAQAYEAIGEWNNAIRSYTQFLSHPGSDIPGFPDADNYAKRLVDFNNSAKDWSFENLDSLVNAIKTALDAGSSSRLWQYHAKSNFFTRTWEHGDIYDGGVAGHAVFNLSDFMRGSRIRYADSLDVSSNANETYLKTWGWQYISTWYLYFRKINFPLDPEIHGRWEWAGIYYGEKS